MWLVEILFELAHLKVEILCHMIRACTGCYGDVTAYQSCV